MKKLAGIILTSTLLLGACGNDHHESSKSESKVNENKVQFKDDTLVLEQATLKIKDVFLVNDKDTGIKSIAFKFEVKSKVDRHEITPNNVFVASIHPEQESDNSVDELDPSLTLLGDKYKEWNEHTSSKIKKGKTAKGLLTYKLNNKNDVTIKITQGDQSKKLGKKTYKLSELKTVDASIEDDMEKSIESNSDSESESSNSNDDETASSTSHKEKTKDTEQNNNNQVASNNTTETKATNSQPNNSNSEKQIGGHPSLYDPSISPDEQFDGPEYSIEVDQAIDEH